MKKILAVLVLLIAPLAGICAEENDFDIYDDISFSVPLIWNLPFNDDVLKSSNLVCFGAGFSTTTMINDFWGVYLGFDFFWPLSGQIQFHDAPNPSNASREDLGYKDWFGFDLLIGPTIRPVFNHKMALMCTPGVLFTTSTERNLLASGHLLNSTDTLTYELVTSDYMLGIGLNNALFLIGYKDVYVKLSVDFNFSFYRWKRNEYNIMDRIPVTKIVEESDGPGLFFVIKPAVSLGFRL